MKVPYFAPVLNSISIFMGNIGVPALLIMDDVSMAGISGLGFLGKVEIFLT
jgi:hypothetical protein